MSFLLVGRDQPVDLVAGHVGHALVAVDHALEVVGQDPAALARALGGEPPVLKPEARRDLLHRLQRVHVQAHGVGQRVLRVGVVDEVLPDGLGQVLAVDRRVEVRHGGEHARGRQGEHHRQRHRHARGRRQRHGRAAHGDQVRQRQPQKGRERAEIAPVVGLIEHHDDAEGRRQHHKAAQRLPAQPPPEPAALHAHERPRQAQPRHAQVEPVEGVLHGRAHGVDEVVVEVGFGVAEQHLHKRPHVRGLHEMIEEALGIGRRHRRGQQVAAQRRRGGQRGPGGHAKAGPQAHDQRHKEQEIRDPIQAPQNHRQAAQRQKPPPAPLPPGQKERQVEQNQAVVEDLGHGRGAVENRRGVEQKAGRKQQGLPRRGLSQRAVDQRARAHPQGVCDDDGVVAQAEELDEPAVEHHRRKAVRPQRAHAGELLEHAVVARGKAHLVPGKEVSPVVQLVGPDRVGGEGVSAHGQGNQRQHHKRGGDQQPPAERRGPGPAGRKASSTHPSVPPL